VTAIDQVNTAVY